MRRLVFNKQSMSLRGTKQSRRYASRITTTRLLLPIGIGIAITKVRLQQLLQIIRRVNGYRFQVGLCHFNAVAVFYPAQLLQAFSFF